MKTITRNLELKFNIEIPSFVTSDGTIFTEIDSEINNDIQRAINNIVSGIYLKKQDAEVFDKNFQFNNFKDNIEGLIYDESNPETYKHFVYHYLKNYYVDSNKSRHYTNGGHWQHSLYDAGTNDLHDKMIKNECRSVKDYILLHLVSGRSVRMYGTGEAFRHVKELKTIDQQEAFWKFVLDSKMLDINESLVISDNLQNYLDTDRTEIKHMVQRKPSIFYLIVMKCWRDNNLQLLDQLIDTYKFDINNFLINNKFELAKLIYILHDDRIHDTYNNGTTCRLETYEGNPLTIQEMKEHWENESAAQYVKFVKYIKTKFSKQLKNIEYYNFKYVKNERTEIIKSTFDNFMKFAVKGESKKSCELLLSEILSK